MVGGLDDKSNLVTQLEAVELLLAAGFQPKRTVYLVFGHDEEVGGRQGAVQVVNTLRQRQVRLDFVLDEGLAVTEGVLAGVKAPLALIGLAEKGEVSLRLTAKASAVVNFRLLPGDRTASVTEHVRRTVNDERIEIQVLDTPAEPSSVSSASAPAYQLVERTVREVFPDAMVAPGLVLAGTDARHFEDIADNVYRFMPIRFYHRLLSQATQ